MTTPQTLPIPTAFMFVEGQDANQRRRVLAHHKREARRQKNLRLAELYQTSNKYHKPTFEYSTGTSPRILEVDEDLALPNEDYASPKVNPTLSLSVTHNRILDLSGEEDEEVARAESPKDLHEIVAIRLAQPRTSLGAGRVDPFSVYPFEEGYKSANLVDHFAKMMPCLEFDVDERSPFNPQHHCCLAEGMNYPPTLHAFMAASGIHFASLDQAVGRLVDYHMAEALRILRNDVENQNHNALSRASIIGATVALAAAEGLRGNNASCRIHLTALKNLLTTVGGLQMLNEYPRVQILAAFVAAIWEASYLPKADNQSPAALKEIQDHLVQFQGFFLKLRLIVSNPCISSEAPAIETHRPNQHFLFGPSGPWRALLSPSAHNPSHTEAGVAVHDIHRSACLLYLCAALVDYQYSITAAEEYLERLFSAFQSHQLDIRPNLRLFVFVLIKTHNDASAVQIEDANRSWLVVRMMQVIKLLSWETRAAVNKSLLSFLLSEPPYSFSEDAVIRDIYSHPSIDNSPSPRKTYIMRGDSDFARARALGAK